MKINIQVATLFEATPIIRHLNLERTRRPELSHCYQNPSNDILLWISGIGSSSLNRKLARLMQQFPCETSDTHWFNIGIAGAIDIRINQGTLLRVSSIHSFPRSESHLPVFSLDGNAINTNTFRWNAARLFTALKPVSQPSDLEEFLNTKDTTCLVDMEGYHWAEMLVKDYRVPVENLNCFKIVSDHADGTAIDFRNLAPSYDTSIVMLLKTLEILPQK